MRTSTKPPQLRSRGGGFDVHCGFHSESLTKKHVNLLPQWRRLYWACRAAPAGKSSSRAQQEAQVDEDIDDMLEEGNVTKDSIMDSSEDEEDEEEDEVDNIL